MFFSTEEACLEYLEKIRWGDKFVCSKCGSVKYWRLGKGLWKCSICSFEHSVTAGTLFQDSHLPLKTWFHAIWYITSQKTGVSALSLQGVIGLGSYRTAWLMLHKIRRAMVRVDRSLLENEVEVDETLVGGSSSGKRGRGAEHKRLVAIAAEVDGKKIGRIRMKHIQSATTKTLHSFIKSTVKPGALIHTDGWRSYRGIDKEGFDHDRIVAESVGVDELMPRIHLVASLFKRWLLGTHQGRFEEKYLDDYLEEYTFRFNRRTSKARGMLFFRVIENALVTQPTILETIKSRK